MKYVLAAKFSQAINSRSLLNSLVLTFERLDVRTGVPNLEYAYPRRHAININGKAENFKLLDKTQIYHS